MIISENENLIATMLSSTEENSTEYDIFWLSLPKTFPFSGIQNQAEMLLQWIQITEIVTD